MKCESILTTDYSFMLHLEGWILVTRSQIINLSSFLSTSYPGSLPTPGPAEKTLVGAGHVNPQILGVNRISTFLLLREEW